MNIQLAARSVSGPETYQPLERHSLRGEIACPGSGDPTEVTIRLTADADFTGVIRIALCAERPDPSARFFLPGFMYGTNRGGAPLVTDSKTPRLRPDGECPASPWWMVRSDRLSHPCAMVFTGGRLLGLTASPYFVVREGCRKAWQPGGSGSFDQYAGFGCSLERGEIWYTLGYENAPWLFVDSHHILPRRQAEENCFRIRCGEAVTVKLYCFDRPAADEREIHSVLKQVYRLWHEPPRRQCSVYETVRDIATAVARDAWIPEAHSYSGFVFDRGTHYENRLLPSISWTNGLSSAVPMLLSARRLGNAEMRGQALDCINHIVRCSLNPRSGLPYLTEEDGIWSNRGWWYEKQPVPGHASYLVGQSVYLVLKAYESEKANGTEHADWLAFAQRILARTEKSRNSDGEYPYVFSEQTGAGLEYDSFSGAWCLAAAACYCRLTGERSYLPGLLESEKWYHDAYIRHEECYGGPLDIDKSIDSEGILAYIRAVRNLHEILCADDPACKDRPNGLLDRLRDALYYEFTFKFCYNSPVRVPPLSTVGWSSCGGSITSVTNPHIHPMSSSVIDEMHYYLRFRDDAYLRSRLEDTVLWSCQCHNTRDREYGYGKTGWMSERFCHSEGLLTETWPDGSPASTWFALMPWACGSILEGLAGEAWKDDAAVIHVYTRPADAGSYPEGLANSVHLAFEAKDTGILPFHKNYGILFAEGRVSAENTIIPLGVRRPGIFRAADGTICICAERVYEDGRPDETAGGKLLLWKTRDLIRFESVGLVDAETLPPGCASASLSVSRALAETALRRWSPVVHTGTSVPEVIRAGNRQELDTVPALVRYSDFSVRKKRIAWDPETVRFDAPGAFTARGAVSQPSFRFPLAEGYGDPVLFRWESKWYYISTNDNLDDIGLYVREADTVEALFAEGITEHLILPFSPERGFEQTFWAPEFHVIGGELYLLFAVSGHVWGPQCHMMKKKKTGRIIDPDGWENPVRVVKKDGSPLAEAAITLDMTYIKAQSGSYVIWSYREHIGTPLDSGSMLYIASVDEGEPWRLTGDPVLLTRPLLGWENVSGTINNEGPHAFQRDGKIRVTYSGGSANRYTYALGLLTADTGSDLLDLRSWTKEITPVLTFYSVDGEYGPGHNSFYVSDDGDLMIAYHAETGLEEQLRCDGIRRVHFRPDGTPYFGMAAPEDLVRASVASKVVTGSPLSPGLESPVIPDKPPQPRRAPSVPR